MLSDAKRLEQANTCHDEDPALAAKLLRAIDAAGLPAERWPAYAFLLNHVLGEKLLRWDDALQRLRTLLRLAQPGPPVALWRQAATAALITRDPELERVMTESLAEASGASLANAQALVHLSAAMFQAPASLALAAGEQVLAALAPLQRPDWQADNPLDAAVAACANNIANGLLERPATDLRHAPVRSALAQAAEQAHRFWLRAGDWVNHERALYLRAMVCNALDEAAWARGHAQAALALLDQHDIDQAQRIDRAFIELEQWHACVVLGRTSDASPALSRAKALAAGFDDDAWRQSFEQRERELQRRQAGAAA
ncbi:MAG: hypothetical protein OEY03_17305 [Rhizobacter sp.]|nr:hypothetical protein [Rhizobacter sp.]